MKRANNINDEEALALESLIDKHGIEMVLITLSEICWAKSTHVAHSWQDTKLAKRWADTALAIDDASDKGEGL